MRISFEGWQVDEDPQWYDNCVYRAKPEPKPVELIERQILNLLNERTPDGADRCYFPFYFIMARCDLDREIVGGFMRSMRNRGLVEYGTGFDADGMAASAGYAITQKGRKEII